MYEEKISKRYTEREAMKAEKVKRQKKVRPVSGLHWRILLRVIASLHS